MYVSVSVVVYVGAKLLCQYVNRNVVANVVAIKTIHISQKGVSNFVHAYVFRYIYVNVAVLAFALRYICHFVNSLL